MVIFISHFFACVWVFAGHIQNYNGIMSWIDKREIANESFSIWYLNAYYFSMVKSYYLLFFSYKILILFFLLINSKTNL